MIGRINLAQASMRLYAANVSYPVTAAATLDTPSLMITASNNNAATIFILGNGLMAADALSLRKNGIPLTKNQSFSFTGVKLGRLGYRNFVSATGNQLYIACNATPKTVILTYFDEVNA
jgi:hypothetical protein